jgi:hypothetical protein
VANVLLTLRGSKIIGTDTLDEPVYKYEYGTTTGGGVVNFAGLEWDTYTVDISNSSYNLAGSNPPIPFVLPPATSLTLPISSVPKTSNSLLLVVTDPAGTLLASASAQLQNAGLSFDITKYTGATGAADFGQVFFPGLLALPYDLTVSLPGYETASVSVQIDAASNESVTLSPL